MKNIVLIAGGESSEWQIALEGAALVERNLDRTRYNVYKVILHGGLWTYIDEEGNHYQLDRNDFTITIKDNKIRPDYALILIHGTPGEDGRLQGYLDMMKVPYSSCGFVASVLTFDKSACKRAVAGTGINLAREILLHKNEPIHTTHIIDTLGLPLFVKPNASGSSFGVSKVKEACQLVPAIENAFTESDQVLMEEYIAGREISCGVMIANGKEYIFPITEMISENEFFDYEAKYLGLSKEITPAPLDEAIVQQVNAMTLTAYKTLNCRGVVRIDFIIQGDTPYMIEVNSIPGMGEHSIIPQQAQAMGMSIKELYNLIIEDTSK